LGAGPVAARPIGLVPRVTQGRKVHEHAVEEKSQPCAFALAAMAHPVHAVVPVATAKQRKAMEPGGVAAINRAHAMFEQRAVVGRHCGRRVHVLLAARQRRGRQVRHLFVQHARVARAADVLGHHVGQPQHVVGTPRADAASGGFVPPMLDVALHELSPGRAQQMRARQVWSREYQRHHVLQLIAKAVRAPGLVVAAPRPQAAADGLIQQPSVQHGVERIVRRTHLHRRKRRVPGGLRPVASQDGRGHTGVPRNQCPRLRQIGAFAKQEHQAALPPGRHLASEVHGGARVQPGAQSARERRVLQCCRPRQVSLSANERRAISGHRHRRLARVQERDMICKVGVVGVPGDDRTILRIEFGHHLKVVSFPRGAQHPFVVRDDAQRPHSIPGVGQRQQ